MAKPLLAKMTPVPETLKIGVHIRIGDSGLSNALKRNDQRYPLGYGSNCAYPALGQTLYGRTCMRRAPDEHAEIRFVSLLCQLRSLHHPSQASTPCCTQKDPHSIRNLL